MRQSEQLHRFVVLRIFARCLFQGIDRLHVISGLVVGDTELMREPFHVRIYSLDLLELCDCLLIFSLLQQTARRGKDCISRRRGGG